MASFDCRPRATENEAPRPQTSVIGCARGALENDLERGSAGRGFPQGPDGVTRARYFDCIHDGNRPGLAACGLGYGQIRRAAGFGWAPRPPSTVRPSACHKKRTQLSQRILRLVFSEIGSLRNSSDLRGLAAPGSPGSSNEGTHHHLPLTRVYVTFYLECDNASTA